jgi:hypothetical protein
MSGIRNGTDRAAVGGQAERPARRPGKASFDNIYDQPDPRAYFRGLQPLGYQIPHHAQRVFQRLIQTAPITRDDGQVTVVDVCCSYGINAALINHEVTLDELYNHYTAERVSTLTSDQLAEKDRAFYAERRLTPVARMIGLDAARNAVAYAHQAGLLDEAFGEDLERQDPSPSLVSALKSVRLVTVTGGVGYITTRTFDRLLRHIDNPVWVAAFVLRTVDYGPVSKTLSRYGLTTQKAARTFPQRRFADADEQRHAITAVRARGISPEGKESTGLYHAEFYLSRPAEHAAAFTADDLLHGGEEHAGG